MSGPAEITESASILDTLLDACRSFVFLCSAHGSIDYANPAALKLFGRAESDFERDSLFEMATNRKDRQLLQQTALNLKVNERKRLEMVLHSVDGLFVPSSMFLCGIESVEGGESRLLVIGDPAEAITPASYVSSVASNNLVIRMLHGCVDPVFLIDPRTRIVRDCNPAAVALFGWSRREFIGSNLQKLYPNVEAFIAIGKRLPGLESISGIHEEEVLLKGRDGIAISCKLTTLCIFGPKSEAELRVAILHDITEAQIREDMLVRLAVRTTELATELAQLTKHQVPIGKESFTNLGFTERQAQLARYAAIGLTTKEMAFRLGLSESTVKNHFSAMFRKFGISSRIELIGLLSDRHILLK
jgi:PAS domain S-box-containing protein